MRQVLLPLLLTAVVGVAWGDETEIATATVSVVCTECGEVAVCLLGDEAVSEAVALCTASTSSSADGTNTTGNVVVTGALTSNTSAPFVTSAETEVTLLCEAGMVQFELTAEGAVCSEAGLSIETALVSMNLTVESDMNSSTMTASTATGVLVLDWEGALLSGLLAEETATSVVVGFGVEKAFNGTAVETLMYVDFALPDTTNDTNETDTAVTTEAPADSNSTDVDLDDLDLDLPSQLGFRIDGVPLFDGSIDAANTSCPLEELTAFPGMSVPGLGQELTISEATFDVCAFVAKTDVTVPFAQITAETKESFTVRGLKLKKVSATVTATHTQTTAQAEAARGTGTTAAATTDAPSVQETDAPFVLVFTEAPDWGTDVPAEVAEYDDYEGDEDYEVEADTIAWGGSVSATTSLFGLLAAPVTGPFTVDTLGALEVALSVETPGFAVGGTMAYASEGCSADNGGAVEVTVASAGLNVSGTMMQTAACGADGVSPQWAVRATLDVGTELFVSGVTVTDVALELDSTVTADGTVSWDGRISGAVGLAGASTVAAEITFDNVDGVTAFAVSGDVQIGAVSGTVAFTAADGVLRGSGTLEYAGAADVDALPLFTAEVVHVLTYTEENAALPVWNVTGSLPSFESGSFTLETVSVALVGSLSVADVDDTVTVPQVQWTGSFAGEATVGEVALTLGAEVVEDTFSALTGTVAVSGAGVAFVGTAAVQVDDATGCVTLVGDGSLTLTGSGTSGDAPTFEGSLLYDRCAVAAGDVRHRVTGSVPLLSYQALTLTSASVELTGTLAADAETLEWGGEVDANANLFGGSASAKVVFADAALQSVSVGTVFMTSNGILSAALAFEYVEGCDAPSTGAINATLRLEGADDLVFAGTASYHRCTGAMEVAGTLAASWNGPAGTAFVGVTVALASTGAGEETLSSRAWTGSITAETSVGVSATISFSSSTSASSVSATMAYADDNVAVTATVGSDCTGTGMVAVTGLPHSIPSMEVAVDFAKNCGDDASADEWTVSGSLGSLRIPFHGKAVTVDQAVVKVVAAVDGTKTVSVEGTFLGGQYAVALSVPVPVVAAGVTLRGTLSSEGSATPDGFAGAWQGGSGSPLGASLGTGSPSLFSGLKEMDLHTVSLEVSFEGSLSLAAAGSLYGIGFDVVVAVQKAGTSSWQYGLAFTADATELEKQSGAPAVVGNVLGELAPAWVRFSVASTAMTVLGHDLDAGLSLAAFLGADSALIQNVKSIAPASLADQIASAESGEGDAAGLTVLANIVSPTEMNVYVRLAGGVALGSEKAVLQEVALAFVIGTGPPEVGFNVVLDLTVGGGDNAQTFTAGGFIGLAATGSLTIALSVDSDEPWKNPFGLKGVSVLFPLAVSMTVSAALLPTQFSFMGGLEVAGTSGYVVVGADLEDFTKTAVSMEVANLDFKRIITDIAGCSSCLGSVGGIIADVSVDHFAGSFNPDPVDDVVITIAAASATIPAGTHVSVQNFTLWSAVKIVLAEFHVTATGMSAQFVAEKLAWGPISISSADGSTGPSFAMALTPTEQYLQVDGKAVILGQTVSLYLDLSDSKVNGSFVYSLGTGMTVAVSLETTGTPGKSGFSNAISGLVSTEGIAQLRADATAFLYELADEADSSLASAENTVAEQRRSLQSARVALDSAEATATKKVSAAQNKVKSWGRQLSKKKSVCKSKEKKCRKKPWKCGAVASCWVSYGAVRASLYAAQKTLTAVKKTVSGAITAAKGSVTAAQATLSAAQGAMQAASAVVGAFAEMVDVAGGSLLKAFQVHTLSFSASLSNTDTAVSFALDMTVLGNRLSYGFSAKLNFMELASVVEDEVQRLVKEQFGIKIPSLL